MTSSTRGTIELIEMRCVKCHALLGKKEPDALRPGRLIEIKCAKCNAFLTEIGDERDSQTTA